MSEVRSDNHLHAQRMLYFRTLRAFGFHAAFGDE